MRKIILFFIISILMSHPCYAMDSFDALYPDANINQSKDKLTDDVLDIVDTYDYKYGSNLDETMEKLTAYLAKSIKESLNSIWKPIILIFMVITGCSIIEPLFAGQHKNLPLLLFGCVQILYLTLSDSKTLFSDGIAALQSLYDFSTILLPCLAGTSVAAGASISAGVKYTAAALFMNLLLNFANSILIPMISVYLLFVVGNTVFEQQIMSVLSKFIRWSCKTALTTATVIFTAYLNIAGLITTTGDLFAVRLTKTTITSALPVVGNILSGAASSLVAGAAIVRNSIGVFGLLTVCAILLFPFVNLGIRYFFFLAIARLADLFPNRNFSNLLEGIAGAYGMLLGAIGSGFAMIFLTLISFMQIVGG